MNIQDLTQEFNVRRILFDQLRQEAVFALEDALTRATIKYHSLPSRIKALDSFLAKARRKEAERSVESSEKPSFDAFEEIQDIVGLRVVCLYLSDVERIGEVIRNTFNVLGEDNKIEGAEVSSFGYMSVHFITTMSEKFAGPRYDRISGTPFEIQVRTIAMDAWANVSHHLDYKTDQDVPEDLRKDFYALSGLFYVADRHFEMFYGNRIRSRKAMTDLFQDAIATPDQRAKQLMNLDSLTAFLEAKFRGRIHSDSQGVSDLLTSLLASGYRTIGEIEEVLDSTHATFLRYEKENPPEVDAGEPEEYNDVGVVRISVGIINDTFIREDARFNDDEHGLENHIRERRKEYTNYRKMIPPKVRAKLTPISQRS